MLRHKRFFNQLGKKIIAIVMFSGFVVAFMSHVLMTHHQMDLVRMDGETIFASTNNGHPVIILRKINGFTPDHYF